MGKIEKHKHGKNTLTFAYLMSTKLRYVRILPFIEKLYIHEKGV